MKRFDVLVLVMVQAWLARAASGPTLLDSSFDPGAGPDAPVHAIVLQPDGRILIAGKFEHYQGVPRLRIARLHPDGALDTSFDPGGVLDGDIESVALTSEGGVLVGGRLGGVTGTGLVQLRPKGSLDEGFAPPLQLRPGVEVTRMFGSAPHRLGSAGSPRILFALEAASLVLDARPFLVAGQELRDRRPALRSLGPSAFGRSPLRAAGANHRIHASRAEVREPQAMVGFPPAGRATQTSLQLHRHQRGGLGPALLPHLPPTVAT